MHINSNSHMRHQKSTISAREMAGKTIGYCTDIEGNLSYWKRYVSMSRVLEHTDSGGVVLKKGCYFVYGGDTCDRGPGDLRILRDLVKLKKHNPDNVHLILGNRDLNKMRLLTELQPEFYSAPYSTYWAGELKQPAGDFTAPTRLKAVHNTLFHI
jgi:hypothetical protein